MQPLVEIGVRQTGHDMNDQSQRQEQDKTLAVPTDTLTSFVPRATHYMAQGHAGACRCC